MAEATLADVVFLDLDDTVVRGETQFAIAADYSQLIIGDVDQFVFIYLQLLVFNKVLPISEIGHTAYGECPLISDKSTRWVFVVHSY